MNIDWQDLTAAAIVLFAVAYLARAGRRALARRKAGCGACAACPASPDSEPAVVELGLPAPKSGLRR